MTAVQIMATLWPEMPHYEYFAKHPLIAGIRLNTAMADVKTLPGLLDQCLKKGGKTPLYFDVKGRQLRITKVYDNNEFLEIDINHPIKLKTPTVVLFKSGADSAELAKVENGTHLIFKGGPRYRLIPGESLNIRSPSLQVEGDLFTEQQLAFLDAAKKAGISRYMLSYTGSQEEIDEFRTIVGDAEIIAKIESLAGLKYVKGNFQPSKNLHLLNARGDLFVEVGRPHQILDATRLMIEKDPETILGSRILLSVTDDSVPSCADLNELAWLLDLGYKRFMFCDGLCLKRDALERAVNILQAVANDHRGPAKPLKKEDDSKDYHF